MPEAVNKDNVTPISHTTGSGNSATTQPTPAPRKMSSKAGNNTLLIFDFNQTIVGGSMCNFFVSKKYSDYNSGEKNSVTEEKIKEFVQNSGIKNKEKLKSVLESALSNGVKVAIVSYKYSKAVEYIVKNHLDLTEEQAQTIKVFEGIIKDQTSQTKNPERTTEEIMRLQNPQTGKHLCFLYVLKGCKKDEGMLPQRVMLVDGNMRNTNPADDFCRNIQELLEKDMKSFLENIDQEIAEVDIKEGELKNITFKGVNVSGKPTTVDYLDEVNEWIESNELHYAALNLPASNGSVHGELEGDIYATIKNSSDDNFDVHDSNNPSPQLHRKLSSSTSPTPPPSYKTDGSEKSLLGDNKKTNRFLQKVKYTMQKKKVTMPFVGLVTACCITSIVLGVQQKEFIGFIGSVNPITIFGGVLASCLVLGVIWELMQAVRTKEHKITERDTKKVLDEILGKIKEDEKCIKSLVLKYSNGNRVYFAFHSLPEKAKNNPNIVELTGQPIYYKSRVNSLINDRIWLPILGTVLITGNITFLLALYSTDYSTNGLNNIVSSYTNPTIYWPIVAISGTILLFTLACAINHWSKTDFKDYLLLHKQDASSENPNETAIRTVQNSQEKINSKLLQVVVERCGHPDITYIVN